MILDQGLPCLDVFQILQNRYPKIHGIPIIPVEWVSTWTSEVRWVDSDGMLWAWRPAGPKI